MIGLALLFVGIAYLIQPGQLRLGLAFLDSDRDQEAYEELESSLANGDSSRKTILSLSQLAEKHNQFERALYYRILLIQRYPKHAPFYDSLYFRYAWLGMKDSCLSLLLQKERRLGFSESDQAKIFELAEYLGRQDIIAYRLWQKFKSSAFDPQLLIRVKEACFNANLIECRIQANRAAVDHNSNDQASLDELAELYSSTGHHQELHQLLSTNPPAPGSEQELRRIAQASTLNDTLFVTKYSSHWKYSQTPSQTLKWATLLEGIGQTQQAESAFKHFAIQDNKIESQVLLLKFYQRTGNAHAEQKTLDQLARQDADTTWINSLWRYHLWQRNYQSALALIPSLLERNCSKFCPNPLFQQMLFVRVQTSKPQIGEWLWNNRKHFPLEVVHNPLPTLASIFSISEQFNWLLRASKETKYAQLLHTWNHQVGANLERSQKTRSNFQQIPTHLQTKMAQFFFAWARNNRLQKETQAWSKFLSPNDPEYITWLAEERDVAWSKQDYSKAYQLSQILHQKGATKVNNHEQRAALARDLWWNKHKTEALGLWQNLENEGHPDTLAQQWIAEDTEVQVSAKYRQRLIEQLLRRKSYDQVWEKYQAWNLWDEAQKIDPSKLSIPHWWERISYAIQQQDWSFVEKELLKYPERRIQTPKAIQEQLLYKAEIELGKGKIGESNYWFQLATSGGW